MLVQLDSTVGWKLGL